MIFATVTGYLGADPEIREDKNRETFATFSVGSQSMGGETDWVNCVAFGKTGGIAEEYLRKGDKVTAIGDMRVENYRTRDGERKSSLSMNVSRLELPKKREESEERPKSTGNRRR